MTKLDFKKFEAPKIEMLQVLDVDGKVVNKDLMPDLSDAELVELMKKMVWQRVLHERSMKLARQGRLGFYGPTLGEEASEMGSVSAMEKQDWIVPAYRDIPQLVQHGLPLYKGFLWSLGHVEGNEYPANFHAIPPQIIIGAQYVQTAGVALGIKKSGIENEVAFTYTGDGGSSQGDFYEGMNFAAAFKAPAVFFVQNNGYAISVPRRKQTAAKTIAQKAYGAGIPGIQVDGMDVLAVYSVSKQAREWVAAGNGPVLIETITYRMGPHSTAGDDPKRYTPEGELAEWQAKDPLVRMRKFLEGKGLWTEQQEEEWTETVNAEIDAAITKAESVVPEKVSDMLKRTFVETPQAIQKQIDVYMKKEAE